jgi:hypothetical protein
MTITVREYLDSKGVSPFAHWLDGLDAIAAAKVATALYRLEQGNFSRVEGVGAAVFECKINFGPRLSGLLWEGRGSDHDPAWRRFEEKSAGRHFSGETIGGDYHGSYQRISRHLA